MTANYAVNRMWIHEHKCWPQLAFDAGRLSFKLADIRHRQGRLLGRMDELGFKFKQEATLSTLTNDVVKSSAIEGEYLNPKEVRSSVARRLGVEFAGLVPTSRDVDGIVEMMLDATQQFAGTLTQGRLFGWHAALFPTGHSGLRRIAVGKWRSGNSDPMRVVSGSFGHEKVHLEAPSADRLEREMSKFLEWFELSDRTDPVLRSGIAHLWFVTIHPFEDGNGRIARAISDMALARSDGISDRFYSLSTQLESERREYYAQLERQQRGTPEITSWLDWFLDCIGRALSGAENALESILFKARLWSKINRQPINDRQRLIINHMLEEGFEGHMNTSKYAKLAKCSTDSALRDIQFLTVRGIFVKNPGGGRSTSYRLPDKVS